MRCFMLTRRGVSENKCLATGAWPLPIRSRSSTEMYAENPAALLYHTSILLQGFSVHAHRLHAQFEASAPKKPAVWAWNPHRRFLIIGRYILMMPQELPLPLSLMRMGFLLNPSKRSN